MTEPCSLLRNRVMTSNAWKELHQVHIGADQELARNHLANEDWRWLICTCGAKHLTGERTETQVQERLRKEGEAEGKG